MDEVAGSDKHKGAGPVPSGDPNGSIEEDVESVPLYKNFKLVIPGFVVILAIAIFAWQWYLREQEYVSTDDAYVDADRVSVSAKILGRVDTLLVDEGDTVQEGEVIARLDDSDLQAQLGQAQAAMRLAEENRALADVVLSGATTDFQRMKTQFRSGVVSQEQFDHAQTELQTAEARIGIARAQVESARAQLHLVQIQLKNTVILAPMSGAISRRWVLPGDVVQPGQPIFALFDLDSVWVTANLEETKLAVVHINDPVAISVDAFPEASFQGRILQTGFSTASQFSLIPPNNASGNFTKITQRVPVKISVDRQGEVRLLPGMSAVVRVKVE